MNPIRGVLIYLFGLRFSQSRGKFLTSIIAIDLEHIPRGDEAQNRLRQYFQYARARSDGKSKEDALREAIEKVSAEFPDFEPEFDRSYFSMSDHSTELDTKTEEDKSNTSTERECVIISLYCARHSFANHDCLKNASMYTEKDSWDSQREFMFNSRYKDDHEKPGTIHTEYIEVAGSDSYIKFKGKYVPKSWYYKTKANHAMKLFDLPLFQEEIAKILHVEVTSGKKLREHIYQKNGFEYNSDGKLYHTINGGVVWQSD